MTKRAHKKFKRMKGDFYRTPPEAVLPLIPHLPPGTLFCEPCAGDGALIDALTSHGMVCSSAYDIEPKRDDIQTANSLDGWMNMRLKGADFIITNPPWTRELLHPMIEDFSMISPTWLLFDADWMHTGQSGSLMQKCCKVVSVGRVSWMGNGVTGLDNAAWYLFDAYRNHATQFVGRAS